MRHRTPIRPIFVDFLHPETRASLAAVQLSGGEKVELVETLLDRGVAREGRRVSKQPGRCCATGCEVPALPEAAE